MTKEQELREALIETRGWYRSCEDRNSQGLPVDPGVYRRQIEMIDRVLYPEPDNPPDRCRNIGGC
jgi:hypothetical protein